MDPVVVSGGFRCPAAPEGLSHRLFGKEWRLTAIWQPQTREIGFPVVLFISDRMGDCRANPEWCVSCGRMPMGEFRDEGVVLSFLGLN